jgi:hypothetical protein
MKNQVHLQGIIIMIKLRFQIAAILAILARVSLIQIMKEEIL